MDYENKSVLQIGEDEIIKWGRDNKFPNYLLEIVNDSESLNSLMQQKLDMASGLRLVFVEERIIGNRLRKERVEDKDLENWFLQNHIQSKVSKILMDLIIFNNAWFEFSPKSNGTIEGNNLDVTECRLVKKKGRSSSQSVIIGDWDKYYFEPDMFRKIPLLDVFARTPTKKENSAIHIKLKTSGFPHYNIPSWTGSIDWVEISKSIGSFHKNGLKNAYQMKYHIQVPMSFVERTNSSLQETKRKVISEFDEAVGGVENWNKSFISFSDDLPRDTKKVKPREIKIEKIPSKIHDKAYLKVHNHASRVLARGILIDPTISGIEKEKNLSSGYEFKDKFNALLVYQFNMIRRLALKPINMMKNHDFPDKRDIKIAFVDRGF